jgi:hypothetical protein
MWCPLFFKGCNGFLIILTKKMEMNFQSDEEVLKETHREEFLYANGWGVDIESGPFWLNPSFGHEYS